MKTAKTLSWLVAIAGAWEIIAPFVLGYSATTAAMWDAIIVGAVVLILAVWAALSSQDSTVKVLDWINALLGVWLVIAPFIVRYSSVTKAMWNDIVVGVVVLVLAAWAALTAGGSVGHSTGRPA